MEKANKNSNKDYATIIIEEMKSRFQAFGEGLSTLSDQFESFRVEQGRLADKVDENR